MAKKMNEFSPEEGTQVSAEIKPRRKRKWFFKLLVLLIIVGLGSAAAYYYKQYKKIKNNPQIISQEETQFVISEVGKLMELPEGTPSLATVEDKDKLKDQNFFRKAENGDKLLIYADAKQAILFRPTTKKIIEVAPLVLSGSNSGVSQEGSTASRPETANQENNQ